MAARLAIYHPSAATGLQGNPFGKDVANLGLFRALVRDAGLEAVDFLCHQVPTADRLRLSLFPEERVSTRIETHSILDTSRAPLSGALLRGSADVVSLAWQRRTFSSDTAYSLLGLIHTIAPPGIRDYIAQAAVAPTNPWDALICTSPSVQRGMSEMFDAFGAHVNARFGGGQRPRPMLPLVPLGVDAAAMARMADRPEARARLRSEYGLEENDVLVLWVGRLSFFEKAYPQPMFRAVNEAAAGFAGRVVFAMSGWFPAEPLHRELYTEAARAYAPDIEVRFENGNDRARLADLWAAGDVFLSLVDNIQETFGITPLEAMAAGMPVVASEWDGYRYTLQDGVQGFLAPTLIAPAGRLGDRISTPHALHMESYQTYAGAIAQYTAVDIGRAARGLRQLFDSPDLRRRMGAAGRERVRTMFDWPVVARLYADLIEELAAIRGAAREPAGSRNDPVRGDPFAAFGHFATKSAEPGLRFQLRQGSGSADLERAAQVRLDMSLNGFRANLHECGLVVQRLEHGGPMTMAQIAAEFPEDRRMAVELGLLWMAKIGVLDWLEPSGPDAPPAGV